jgi:hypothetical protein
VRLWIERKGMPFRFDLLPNTVVPWIAIAREVGLRD